MKICSAGCGTYVWRDENFCSGCGAKPEEVADEHCPQCKEIYFGHQKFCSKCGYCFETRTPNKDYIEPIGWFNTFCKSFSK